METHYQNAVCPSLPVRGNPKTKLRGTKNETSDEIHGQHHGVAMVKRMHGHGDQALEWWALYVEKKERSLFSMHC